AVAKPPQLENRFHTPPSATNHFHQGVSLHNSGQQRCVHVIAAFAGVTTEFEPAPESCFLVIGAFISGNGGGGKNMARAPAFRDNEAARLSVRASFDKLRMKIFLGGTKNARRPPPGSGEMIDKVV
ncbi:MAG: hypothetical protein AB7S71_19590, partial [Dongiaceae bacterium]